MEKRKVIFGHETGVVIVLGIGLSYLMIASENETPNSFDPKVLFDFGLPLILYATGFNLRRKRFFENINTISMFGILSTVVCFLILTLLTTQAFNSGYITKYTYQEETQTWK